MKESTRLLSFLLLVLIFAGGGFMLGRRSAQNRTESKVIRDTVSYTIYDTIVREKPVYRYSYKTDTIHTYFTTVMHDSVMVEVPIEHKVYAEDSLYRAVVSGWHPSLDSLTVYPKTTTITITNTVKTEPPRWSFGATLGPSVLATSSGQVKTGLGVTAGLTYHF